MRIQQQQLSTGVSLEYALSGPEGAEVLCFVHGASANLRQFEAQARHFSGYRVLLLSLRGHGGSSAPVNPTLKDYTLRILALDVLALLDALDTGQVHYVGNSVGGLIGFELLELAPERLLSLTTFGTTAALSSPESLVRALLTMYRLLGPKGMAWLVSKTASKDREVGKLVGNMCREASKDALILLAENIANYDYTPLLGTANLPILLIKGELDTDINKNLASTLEVLRQTADFTLLELPEAGHFANLDNPAGFNAALKAFIEKHSQETDVLPRAAAS